MLLSVLTLVAAGTMLRGGDAPPPAAAREEEAFHSISLPSSVRLYVPGTKGGSPAPELQAAWTEQSLAAFSELFGGATALRAEGAWRQGDSLVREPVIIVYSHTTPEVLQQRRAAVVRLAKRMATEMEQNSVAVEFDQALVLLERAEPNRQPRLALSP